MTIWPLFSFLRSFCNVWDLFCIIRGGGGGLYFLGVFLYFLGEEPRGHFIIFWGEKSRGNFVFFGWIFGFS
jgi:hypothetical protein